MICENELVVESGIVYNQYRSPTLILVAGLTMMLGSHSYTVQNVCIILIYLFPCENALITIIIMMMMMMMMIIIRGNLVPI